MKVTRKSDGTEILEGDALELAEFERNRTPLTDDSTYSLTPHLDGSSTATWKTIITGSCLHANVPRVPTVCGCPMTCVCRGWSCGTVTLATQAK